MSPRRARTYTLDEKRHAIARALEIGFARASRELNLPSGTLSCWVFKARSGKPGYPLPESETAPLPQVKPSESHHRELHDGDVSSTETTLAEGASPAKTASASTETTLTEAPLLEAVSTQPTALTEVPLTEAASSAQPTTLTEGAAEAPGTPSPDGQAIAPPSTQRRVARVYTPSQRQQALQLAAEVGITEASRQLGISRFSLYEWRRRVALAAEGEGDDPTSGPSQVDLARQRDQEILEMWRAHPGLGPSQIRNQLRRKGVKASVTTVRRVMEANGYRPPKIKRQAHTRRYEAVRPNHLWHMDFVHRYIHQARTFTLILIDDHSRFVVGHGVDDAERADMVLETFEEAVNQHGKPEMVMHDKGSAFWSWKGISRFTRLLVELGIDQIVAEHKEWNGKVENFNGNLAKELFDVREFACVADMKRHLSSHLHFYNHRRTHHALGGMLVPADRYFGRVEEVLARIQAGGWNDAHTDLLALHERTLDLLRIVQRNGVPEIWLLGQRVGGLEPRP